jgi:3-deoxy-D-manno-octulosonic-acid transferase
MKRFFSFLLDWPLLPYNLTLMLSAPIVLPLKAWRYFKKGWKREYDMRRWFVPALPKTENASSPHVVIMATSWGEMRLAALLDEAIKREQPNVRTTWVLRDGEAAAAAQAQYPEQSITFLPFDFIIPVLIWLRRVQPDCVVFLEKFWFPNLVRGCKNWGATLMVANARTRAHDSARYRLLEPFHRWIAGSFSAFAFQSDEDLKRAGKVLAPGTKTLAPGNLKFALRPTPDESKTNSLEQWLQPNNTPILAAGSLEEGDLAFVLEAFRAVREKTKCRLMVAPRRLPHTQAMQQQIEPLGLSVSLRSVANGEKADVYLLDTMGELSTAYQFAQAAFVGGTLGHGAGHNVVEPLAFGVPVSYGFNRGFFESVQKACEAEGVGFRVYNPRALAVHWHSVLESESLRRELGENASRLLSKQTAALEGNVGLLVEILEKAEPEKPRA